jgi:23S rRNA pseudouridine2605 synthase
VREGRKHEVRAMCAAVHLRVLRLIRVRFGPLTLGDLPPGATRPLTEKEMTDLPPQPPSLKGRGGTAPPRTLPPLPFREGGWGGRSVSRGVRSKIAVGPRRGTSSAGRSARGRGRGASG